jgi:hypothetical protein
MTILVALSAGCGDGEAPSVKVQPSKKVAATSLSKDERVRWERYRKLNPNYCSLMAYDEKKKEWSDQSPVYFPPFATSGITPEEEKKLRREQVLQAAQHLAVDTGAQAVIDMTSKPDPEIIKWFFWKGTEVKSGDSAPDPALEKSLRSALIEKQRDAK